MARIRSNITNVISSNFFVVVPSGDIIEPPPEAAISVAMVEQPAITAGSTQTFTVADFGTPKAAMFIVTNATVVGTPAEHAKLSFGVTDGVRHRVTTMRARNDNAASDALMHSTADEVISILHQSSTLVESEANFSQWVTDGVEINWGVLPSVAHRVICVLFGGDDLSAHVNEFTSSAVLNEEVNVVDPGFEPDQVIILTRRGLFNDTPTDESLVTIGICDNGTSVVQGSINTGERDARATTTLKGVTKTNRVAQDFDNITADTLGSVELDNFDAQGFSAFNRQAGSVVCGYLALAYGGGSHWAGNINSPIVGGSTPQAGVGFTPQFVLYVMSHNTVVDTVQVDGEGGVVALGAFTADDEFCAAYRSRDNQVTTDTDSILNNQAIDVPLHTGLGGHQATFVSMDAGGWTLNYAGVDGTARLWAALAIG